jgi:AraC-like DNA-binding protein
MTPHLPSSSPLGNALLDTPGRRLFASRDLDETRALVGRVMKPHQLHVAGSSQRLDSRMHHTAFGKASLSRLKYGADVDIRPGPLESFYLVQMPLQGCARIESGAQVIDSTPELASVLSPMAATAMRWSADNDQILLRIDRDSVDRALTARLGRPASQPLEFQLGFRWRDCVAWRCMISYLLDCAAQCVDLDAQPLVAAQMEQLVVTTLLAMHVHNHSHVHPARGGSVLPRHVRKVQDYLHAHADEPVNPDDLARLAGVSLRSLYAGFKEHAGTTPMQCLKDIRLNRARAELQAASADATVASIALRWGFGHLGRFSADYRARFGESPSQTRQRG